MSYAEMPLPQLCEAYLRSRATLKDAANTTRRYQNEMSAITTRVAGKLGREVSGLTVTDLTATAISDALADYASLRSKSTVAGCCSVWTGFGKWLVRVGALSANPAEHLDRPRMPRATPKALAGGSPTVQRLLASVRRGDRPARRPWPQRDLALLATFAASGVRREEAAQLNMVDLDRSSTGFQFRVTGKGGEQRWVPIGAELVAVLDEYQSSRIQRFPPKARSGRPGDREPLLVDDNGRRLAGKQIWYIVAQCYKAAGVSGQVPHGAMVHALRHTYATLLAEQGAAATDLQALLGHRSLLNTQIYVSVTNDRLRAVADLSPALEALRLPEEDSDIA